MAAAKLDRLPRKAGLQNRGNFGRNRTILETSSMENARTIPEARTMLPLRQHAADYLFAARI